MIDKLREKNQVFVCITEFLPKVAVIKVGLFASLRMVYENVISGLIDRAGENTLMNATLLSMTMSGINPMQ